MERYFSGDPPGSEVEGGRWCTYVSVYACTHACVCVRMVCVYVWGGLRVRVCVRLCVYIRTCGVCTCVVCVRVCTCGVVCVRVYVWGDVCTCVYVYVRSCRMCT